MVCWLRIDKGWEMVHSIPMVDLQNLSLLLIQLSNLWLQSPCRYNEQAQQEWDNTRSTITHEKTKPCLQWNPYDFTGCLAHVEVTETVGSSDTTCIVGYFIHNKACKQAVLKHLPVYEVVLAQLALFLFSTPTGNWATHAGYKLPEEGVAMWWARILERSYPWSIAGLKEEYVHLATLTSVNSQLELQIDCKCWPWCNLCFYIKLRGSLWAAFEWCNHNHHESWNQTPYISQGKLDAGWHVEKLVLWGIWSVGSPLTRLSCRERRSKRAHKWAE